MGIPGAPQTTFRISDWAWVAPGLDGGAGRIEMAQLSSDSRHIRAHDAEIPQALSAAESSDRADSLPSILSLPQTGLSLRNLRVEFQQVGSFPSGMPFRLCICSSVCPACLLCTDSRQVPSSPKLCPVVTQGPPGCILAGTGAIPLLWGLWSSMACPPSGDSHSGQRELK